MLVVVALAVVGVDCFRPAPEHAVTHSKRHAGPTAHDRMVTTQVWR